MQDKKPASPVSTLEVIGYDSGWGCANFGCEDGPRKVSAHNIIHLLGRLGLKTKWRGPLGLKFLGNHAELTTKEATYSLTLAGVRRLANTVKHAIEAGNTPVVIGGDHSSAIGTWSGAVAATKSFGNFGLIWIDAHLDAHTYETSHQGKWGGWWHGQPVTALTGFGKIDFTSVGGNAKKLSPRHISIIGPHSFEPAEAEFVKKHGIRVYFLDEVRQRGFKAVYEEALKRATDGTSAFGLTIDLDAFQPADAPGVGTTEDEGLVAAEVLPVLKSTGRLPGFTALELAEFNPHQDKNDITRKLIEKLVESIFTES